MAVLIGRGATFAFGASDGSCERKNAFTSDGLVCNVWFRARTTSDSS